MAAVATLAGGAFVLLGSDGDDASDDAPIAGATPSPSASAPAEAERTAKPKRRRTPTPGNFLDETEGPRGRRHRVQPDVPAQGQGLSALRAPGARSSTAGPVALPADPRLVHPRAASGPGRLGAPAGRLHAGDRPVPRLHRPARPAQGDRRAPAGRRLRGPRRAPRHAALGRAEALGAASARAPSPARARPRRRAATPTRPSSAACSPLARAEGAELATGAPGTSPT